MASLIGRAKNIDFQTIKSFLGVMPKESMNKSDFDSIAESKMPGFTKTFSQVARQLGLYYTDSQGISHPRFSRQLNSEEIMRYANFWAKRYFIPNPYTEGYPENCSPKVLYTVLSQYEGDVPSDKDELAQLLGKLLGIEELSNTDKVKAFLLNVTTAYVDSRNCFIFPDSDFFSLEVDIDIKDQEAYFHYYDDDGPQSMSVNTLTKSTDLFLQTIYYGAPGTGKSHKIKTLHKENVVRTTFHPDSDYSTFVGAYKPTMEEVERYESSGTPIREKRIVYNYVPQAFLRAYTSAWKNYPEPQYLVIEEINRGNCAQIFGDLFQLLDRHETGFSDYPICTDSDIQRYLSEEFSKCDFTEIIGEETEAIQEMYAQECPDILNQLQLGNLLLLPKNLYILATMNTSDQSLFPIDSAFKRRWHWEYTPIRNGVKEWTIEADGQHWDWWEFLQAINERIEEATSSEDKKLGYFFVKAGGKGASIKASLFVGKVIFYLWNDVYKDYGFDDSIFQDSNGKQMTFPRFYETNEANEEVNEVLVANFLRNVVGKSIEESHSDEINENKE